MLGYRELVKNVLYNGEPKEGRNGTTIALSGTQLKFDAMNIPLLNGRKIYYKGVFGEFAAFMHGANSVEDFKKFGCNYWDSWADGEGNLNLDYVNQLHKKLGTQFSYMSQLEKLKRDLKHDPYSRRHILNLWVPENLHSLSLPCCHFNYQFIVSYENKLDMIWTQRSADVMIGIPADMILAWLWVTCLSKELGFTPGEITMNFGDTHIYEEHIEGANHYVQELRPRLKPLAGLTDKFTTIEKFTPDMIDVSVYEPHPPIKFILKS